MTINESDREIIDLIIKNAVREAFDEREKRDNDRMAESIRIHKETCPHGLTILKTKATLTGIVIACSTIGGGIGTLAVKLIGSLMGQ